MTSSTSILLTKLDKLSVQIRIAELSDFSYPDGLAALGLLKDRIEDAKRDVKDADLLPESTRLSVQREANYTILNLTKIVGMVMRSSSVRNAFELYVPFLDICKEIIGSHARLLLSSEWQYVPFTYPQNLADLPDFIVIGLPAPESDNMLVFPAAGHELGHSVWNAKGLSSKFKALATPTVLSVFQQNKNRFYSEFPRYNNADLDQDVGVQSLKAISLNSALAQIEELFCDMVGIILFGEGYLRSFEYLVAPMLIGGRSSEYPEMKNRASILAQYALKSGVAIDASYDQAFTKQSGYLDPGANFLVEMADAVVETLLDETFNTAEHILCTAGVRLPSADMTASSENAFKQGVPYTEDAAIGDLINAAWRIYRTDDHSAYEKQGRLAVDYLSDLVIKSSEIYEIKKHVRGI